MVTKRCVCSVSILFIPMNEKTVYLSLTIPAWLNNLYIFESDIFVNVVKMKMATHLLYFNAHTYFNNSYADLHIYSRQRNCFHYCLVLSAFSTSEYCTLCIMILSC